jgi:hypothetical protein
MYPPANTLKGFPVVPTTDEEERAYCSTISRMLLEYETNPNNFLKSMRARGAIGVNSIPGIHRFIPRLY